MNDDFALSSDILTAFIEVAEMQTTEAEADTEVKENLIVSGIKAVARQLSIRDFFKGPKRKLERADNEESDNETATKTRTAVSSESFLKLKASASRESLTKAKAGTSNAILPTNNSKKQYKQVPQFKWIPGSAFVVDAFNYGLIAGAEAYFLSHFHSDHYQGLNGRFWTDAPSSLKLFCSPVTANLVKKELKVPEERICRLQVGTLYAITPAWSVGVLDANHCPGSVMFVFWDRSRDRWHLHTGDFRFHPGLLKGAKLQEEGGKGELFDVSQVLFDHVFLDTTYARPDYAFPSQDEVIASCISGCQSLFRGQHSKATKWLIAVGSYLIGKERIILALADFFDCKIFADDRKRGILAALQWPELTRRLTDDPKATPFHIVSMAVLSKQKLNDYRARFSGRFTHVLGIRPTGWSFSKAEPSATLEVPKTVSKEQATVWSLPYSEHSSYAELGQFLREVAFRRVVPTVDNWKGIGHDVAKCNYNTDLLLQMISHKG